MEKEVYHSDSRGGGDFGWLKTRHSFSFGDYMDPNRMGFGALRVFNDDIIGPSAGFSEHPHSDMEIISIVTEGEIAHKDSTGAKSILRKGEIQVMTAGKGVNHSEFNNSADKEAKFFQIWITPNKKGLVPTYSQRYFGEKVFTNKLVKVVSGNKSTKSLFINQEASICIGNFSANQELFVRVRKGKGFFIFVIEGKIRCAGEALNGRASCNITGPGEIQLVFLEKSKIIAIEVPLAGFE